MDLHPTKKIKHHKLRLQEAPSLSIRPAVSPVSRRVCLKTNLSSQANNLKSFQSTNLLRIASTVGGGGGEGKDRTSQAESPSIIAMLHEYGP